jgi:hypothetical protein
LADAQGLWDSATAGRREFVDALANACLLQVNTRANLDLITDLKGMLGYSTDQFNLVRNSGTANLGVELIETGVDASKPAGSAANNGRLYFATDTKILYYVKGGALHILDEANAKGWCSVAGDGTLGSPNHNITSAAKDTTGEYTVTWAKDFGNATYSAQATGNQSNTVDANAQVDSLAVGDISITTRINGTLTDANFLLTAHGE